MNRFRKQKLFKLQQHSLPTHTTHTHTHNVEEAAKMNLIEISHDQYLHKDDENDIDKIIDGELPIDNEPEPMLQKNMTNHIQHIGSDDREQLISSFKRLTEDLQRIGRDKKYIHSDQSYYRFGDKFLNITLRNPLAISSYVVSGGRKATLPRNNTNPPVSQYVIRQQRNLHKLRKSETKYQSENSSINSYRKTQLRYYSKNADGQGLKINLPLKNPTERTLT